MGRSTEKKAEIEAKRLEILHREQRKLRKRLNQEVKVKKAGGHLPGEEHLKKNIAVFLKIGVPGISYTEIAARIGEPKKVVRDWFKSDPVVIEQYDWVLNNFSEGALELMKTYSLEAVETQVLLMRYGSEKYMFEASKELLDRIGVPKISRQEIDASHTTRHEWSDHDAMVAQIRELSPELQEEAIKTIEQFEKILATNSEEPEVTVDDENELPAVINDQADEDDEEEEGPSED